MGPLAKNRERRGRRAGQGRRAAAHLNAKEARGRAAPPSRRRRVAVGGRAAARRHPAAGAGTHAAGELYAANSMTKNVPSRKVLMASPGET